MANAKWQVYLMLGPTAAHTSPRTQPLRCCAMFTAMDKPVTGLEPKQSQEKLRHPLFISLFVEEIETIFS